MKNFILLLVLKIAFCCNGANVLWNCFSSSSIVDGQFRFEWSSADTSHAIWVDVAGSYSANGKNVTLSANSSTIEFIGNWVLASYGEKIDASTTMNVGNYFLYGRFDKYGPMESKYSNYDVTIRQGEDTYLVFCAEVLNGRFPDFEESGLYLYGWVKLKVDTNGVPVLEGSAIDLDGGPMIVGGGAYSIPEPSGGLLSLLGGALLTLRRRHRLVV